MPNYRAIIMTVGETQNGTRFSKESIEHIAESKNVKVVDSSNGTVLGVSKELVVSDNVLIATLEIKKIIDLDLGLYVVPFGVCKSENIEDIDGVRVIKEMNLVSLMLTRCPADPNLTPIERNDL